MADGNIKKLQLRKSSGYFRPSVGRQTADSRPTVGRQSADRFFGELFFTITVNSNENEGMTNDISFSSDLINVKDSHNLSVF